LVVLVIALLVVVSAIAFAIVLRRRPAPVYALSPATNSLTPVGEDFAALSEAERCDLIFAVAVLEDDSSEALLARALGDPSEGVALAAAHALARRGGLEMLERHLTQCASERARSLRLLVEILD
jgi:DNA-binding transcriptional LysR family regulator